MKAENTNIGEGLINLRKANIELKVADNFSGAVNKLLTIQNNKLLAIFMGGEDRGRIVGGCDTIAWYLRSENGVKIYKELFYNQLAYNKDWNLLMEVVTVIKSLNIEEYRFIDDIDDALMSVDIEMVFLNCANAVHYYNKTL
jgi:hypothetical protein